jgi:hypothetical protein
VSQYHSSGYTCRQRVGSEPQKPSVGCRVLGDSGILEMHDPGGATREG